MKKRSKASALWSSVLFLSLMAQPCQIFAASSQAQPRLNENGVFRYNAGLSYPSPDRQALPGSVNRLVASGKAHKMAALDPQQKIRFGFVLKPRSQAALPNLVSGKTKISQAQFKAEFAPSADSVQAVHDFVASQGLKVVYQSPNLIEVEATTAQAQQALHVKMNHYQLGKTTFYANSNAPEVPNHVASAINGIVGLTQVKYSKGPSLQPTTTDTGASAHFTPDAIRSAYGLTQAYGNKIDGTGRSIAVLMDGTFKNDDVKTFSEAFGLPYDDSKILSEPVPGAPVPTETDPESTLDMEWTHAIAPGATITEYETGDMSFLSMFAGFDTILQEQQAPDVVNMSFGAPETFLTPDDIASWHMLFAEAVARGITPVAASGDSGAFDPVFGTVSASSPADDPLVLAVGGTDLTIDSKNGWSAEKAWGSWQTDGTFVGSGGGYSQIFSDLQGSPQRGVPDVSMPADSLNLYMSELNGWLEGGGTSFAAPMWSGILALAAQKENKSLGWINPTIKTIAKSKTAASLLHDITTGTNGHDNAGKGWDAVTGWGTPANGWSLVQALATTKPTPLPSGAPNITGVIADQGVLYTDNMITGGVPTMDLIGSGFGDAYGTITLSGSGKTYPLVASNWTDHQITINLNALFESSNAPSKAGTYQVQVKVGSKTSNLMPIKVAEFFHLEHDDQTPVSIGSKKSYQTVTAYAVLPNGSLDKTYSRTGNFFFSQSFERTDAHITVMQGSKVLTANKDGGYPVKFSGGKATLQIATDKAESQGLYGMDADGMLPGLVNDVTFTGGQAVALSNTMFDTGFESVGKPHHMEVSLLDANGNVAPQYDALRITVTGGTGIQLNGMSMTNGGSWITSSGGGGAYKSPIGVLDFDLEEDQANTITLTISDESNSSIKPWTEQLTFTPVTQLTETLTNSFPTVTVPGQAADYQELQITSQNVSSQVVGYNGPAYLNMTNLLEMGSNDTTFRVEQQMSDNSWKTVASTEQGYPIKLSSGTANVRVSSDKAGNYSYDVSLPFGDGDDSLTASKDGFFVANQAMVLQAEPQFPHMATGNETAPLYDPVHLWETDANGNQSQPPLIGSGYTLTEAEGGPEVIVAEQDQSGEIQVVQPEEPDTWQIDPNAQLLIASEQPGVAQFTVSDSNDKAIPATDFQVSFVNSMVDSVQTAQTTKTGTGLAQKVVATLVDANGQPVVSAIDTVALQVGPHKGSITVTDAAGKAILAVKGSYSQPANGGNAIFWVKDSKIETLTYTLHDQSELVNDAQTTGDFLAPSKAPSASNIKVTNNQVGTDDTVDVKGLTADDVVKVYDDAAKDHLLATSDPVVGTETIVSIPQIGLTAGSVYVTVTNIGKAESAALAAKFVGEKSGMLDFTQVTVLNNRGKADTIHVTDLSVGDVVKVYTSPTIQTAKAVGKPLAQGQTDITLSVSQLGTGPGFVYVTVTHAGMFESDRMQYYYPGE